MKIEKLLQEVDVDQLLAVKALDDNNNNNNNNSNNNNNNATNKLLGGIASSHPSIRSHPLPKLLSHSELASQQFHIAHTNIFPILPSDISSLLSAPPALNKSPWPIITNLSSIIMNSHRGGAVLSLQEYWDRQDQAAQQ